MEEKKQEDEVPLKIEEYDRLVEIFIKEQLE